MFGLGCLAVKIEQLRAVMYVNAHPLSLLKEFGAGSATIPKLLDHLGEAG